ncbi:MAG: type II secretion system protein [bacterium]|nr:type II secretion system protein [bacterium]
MRRSGFTLIEVMIVVGIIGLLAAVAVPNFLRARGTTQRHACWNSLRQFNAAKDQYALECNMWSGALISPSSALDAYLINLRVTSSCPGGGTYQNIDGIGTPVTCNVHGSPS